MNELIQNFSLDRVGKAGAKFDFDKTKWFNQQYLREKEAATLAALLSESVNDSKAIDLGYLTEVCELMKERATFIKDIGSLVSFSFTYRLIMMKKLGEKNGMKIRLRF